MSPLTSSKAACAFNFLFSYIKGALHIRSRQLLWRRMKYKAKTQIDRYTHNICHVHRAKGPCRNPFCRCDERTSLCVVPTLDSASGAENWCNSKVGQLMSHFWAVAVIKLLCGAQLVRSRWQLSCLRVARCITGGSPCMRHQSTDQQKKKRLSPNIRFSWSYVHVQANSLNMTNEAHVTQHSHQLGYQPTTQSKSTCSLLRHHACSGAASLTRNFRFDTIDLIWNPDIHRIHSCKGLWQPMDLGCVLS